jgi:hypothetical protein
MSNVKSLRKSKKLKMDEEVFVESVQPKKSMWDRIVAGEFNNDSSEFKTECFKDIGIVGNPKADAAYSIAYEHAHAYGYGDVYLLLQDLATLIK